MKGRYLPLALVFAAFNAGAAAAQVTVHEDKLTLSAWNEGLPDPNPQFAFFFNDYFPNYPYTLRNSLNKSGHPEPFRVIILENEYLSCRVLPDLGGHLHGCTDKLTGREVFYANPAVRRMADAQRSTFFPSGIESSFPYAHSRVSSSPVDFAFSEHDGVGRVIVEDTDRVSGMRWRVEFILRRGVAVLEQKVTLYNGSDARRGYHWWSNAAVELDDPHLRFVYPVKWMLPHGDTPMTSWPLSATGVDLSDAANYKDQTGLFAHGSNEPWMAVYKPKFRSGLAHYADPQQVRGKKLWLWGTGDKYVKETLTQNFNSYIEMQAGLFETQPEFAFLIPEGSRTFSHYWIPFHGLGGVSRATPDAVLNLARSGKTATVELQATHPIAKARIRIALEGRDRTLLETETDLDPKTVWSKSLEAPAGHIVVDVTGAPGVAILHHVEDEYDGVAFDQSSPNPEPVAPSAKLVSESAFLERGLFNEQRDQPAFAWGEYLKGLEKYPSSRRLSEAAGRLAFLLHRYDDAVRLLAPSITGIDVNPAYEYYYGVASLRTNTPRQASTTLNHATLNHAAKDAVWGPAARLELALVAAREKDTASALLMIQALAANPEAGVRVGGIEVAILRRVGKEDTAKQRLKFWLDIDPADNLLRAESVLLENRDEPALWEHLAGDPERVLDLADVYLEIGAPEDALKLLERRYPTVPPTQAEPGKVLPQDNPLIAYYRGYCRSLAGQSADADFKAASALSTLNVFPHRASSYPVLKAAVAANDGDAVAHALLGDLYFDSLDADRAIAEWRRASALKPGLPALERNLGKALLEVKGDSAAAQAVLLVGVRMDPGDGEIAGLLDRARAGTAHAQQYVIPRVMTAELLNPGPLLPPKGEPPAPPPPKAEPPKAATPALPAGDLASVALVRSVLDPEGANSTFSNANFPKEKQPDPVRRAYIEVQLQRLFDLARHKRCGEAISELEKLGDEDTSLPFTLYGFGAFMKAPHFQYYRGMLEQSCGDDKAAKKSWGKLPGPSETIKSADDAFPYLAMLNTGNAAAKSKIEAAAAALKPRVAEADAPPDLVFAEGVLLAASGHADEGATLLERSARAQEALVQYMSLVALRDMGRR